MRLRGADGKGIDTWPQLRVTPSVSAASADALLTVAGRTSPRACSRTCATASCARSTCPARSRWPHARRSRRWIRATSWPASTAATRRRSEHVVFSAHLDHVGIGAPVDGDAIYNGALDNALGIAVMLEAANRLAHEPPPQRSLLFVAVTAEEKGLLGAEWFARNPTVPRESLVANVNMDMPMLLAPDLATWCRSASSTPALQALVQQAAKEVGVELSPDPSPEEVVFVRSDQYAFIRAGVPAVYLDGGYSGRRRRAMRRRSRTAFLHQRYHQPGDDVSQPIQYADAARLALLNARIGR